MKWHQDFRAGIGMTGIVTSDKNRNERRVVAMRGRFRSWLPILLGGFVCSLLLLEGCSSGLRTISVINTLPPYTGEVKVIEYPKASTGENVFVADYDITVAINRGSLYANTMPTPEHMDAIKKLAGEKGANVVQIRCGESGTTGAGRCQLSGFFER
jgi:hypothetical protein